MPHHDGLTLSDGPFRSPGSGAGRRPGSLRWRLRRRAIADTALALLLLPGVLMLSDDPHTRLRLAIVAVAFGLLAFLIRRNQDLAAVRADVRARDAALAGRGISIGAWHAGRPLAPWADRVGSPAMADRVESPAIANGVGTPAMPNAVGTPAMARRQEPA